MPLSEDKWIEPDKDLGGLGTVSLLQVVMRLRMAIRYHRDQKGDDRCFLDDNKLYESLPETNTAELTLPAREEFLGSCKKFWECRQGKTFKNADECYDSGEYRSLNNPTNLKDIL